MIWPLSLLFHHRHPPTPVPPAVPPLPLGLNVHELTPERVALCQALGVRQVRTTLYTDPHDAMAQTDTLGFAIAAGLDVLVVVHGSDPSDWLRAIAFNAPRFPSVAWQLGNECEATIRPSDYVDLWRAVRAAAPEGTRLVTAAVGGPATALYLDALLEARLTPHAVAVHAYGPPPAAQLRERCATVSVAQQCYLGVTDYVPIWCTEFGLDPAESARLGQTTVETYPAAARDAWAAVAQAARGLGVARAYGYCLDRDPSFAIAMQPTAAWLRATQGGT